MKSLVDENESVAAKTAQQTVHSTPCTADCAQQTVGLLIKRSTPIVLPNGQKKSHLASKLERIQGSKI